VHWLHNSWLDNSLFPALVILLGAWLIVRFAHWAGAIRRRDIDDRIRESIESGLVASEGAKRSRTLSEAIEWVVVALACFLGGLLALERLGLPLTTLVAPATVIGIGLGFGAQQVVGDLLAGFFLFAEHQFAFGDVIRLSMPGQSTGVTGTVEEITLRVTKLRTAQGELVIVPNSALRQVTNLSKDWARAVIDIPIPVDEDLEVVTHLLRDAIDAMTRDDHWRSLILGEPVVAGVESIEVGYVQLRLIARTLPGRQFEVGREIRFRAATALRAAGVTSPPIGDSATRGVP
jgi:moderate conductance mechanosensitive channel